MRFLAVPDADLSGGRSCRGCSAKARRSSKARRAIETARLAHVAAGKTALVKTILGEKA